MSGTLTILGAGRVGSALASRSPRPCRLITRDQGWSALAESEGPIVVAVGCDALGEVVDRVPAARWPDLAFVQNGMISPWLAARGLGESTRGLLYFAVPRRGAPIEPGGVSLFAGPHAAALVAWFTEMALPAAALARGDFEAAMFEKLIWNAAFGLLCERFECPVGQVLAAHDAELTALVEELVAVARAAGVALDPAPLAGRLRSYSRSIPAYRGAVKDWEWRNGWFVRAAADLGVPTPVHAALLRHVGRLA